MEHDASGERRLMLAVLNDGIRGLLQVQRALVSAKRARQELAWVTSTDHANPFGFENVCDVLGIDASWLRRRLLAGMLPAPRALRRMPPPRRRSVTLRARRGAAGWDCT